MMSGMGDRGGVWLRTDVGFEVIHIPYDLEEYREWKARNPAVVPAYALNWGGPGVSNGYGYAEWRASQYFADQGYESIITDFNLVSKTSKYTHNNEIIKGFRQRSDFGLFSENSRKLISQGFRVATSLDLFLYRPYDCFFADAKKDHDKLSESQARFMFLANYLLDIQTKIVHLTPSVFAPLEAVDVVSIELPDDFTLSRG